MRPTAPIRPAQPAGHISILNKRPLRVGWNLLRKLAPGFATPPFAISGPCIAGVICSSILPWLCLRSICDRGSCLVLPRSLTRRRLSPQRNLQTPRRWPPPTTTTKSSRPACHGRINLRRARRPNRAARANPCPLQHLATRRGARACVSPRLGLDAESRSWPVWRRLD